MVYGYYIIRKLSVQRERACIVSSFYISIDDKGDCVRIPGSAYTSDVS